MREPLRVRGAVKPNSICVVVCLHCGGCMDLIGTHNKPGYWWNVNGRFALFLEPSRSLAAYQDACECYDTGAFRNAQDGLVRRNTL